MENHLEPLYEAFERLNKAKKRETMILSYRLKKKCKILEEMPLRNLKEEDLHTFLSHRI